MIGRAVATLVALAAAAACGGPGPSPSPSASPGPTASQSAVASPTGSAPGAAVTSAAQAAALVMASNPLFLSLVPPDPELIGGCCFYEAIDAPPGYQVSIELGWGDCPAGCISHHNWLFQVDPDGAITTLDETGDVPVEREGGGGQGPATVTAHLRAGPVCPVVEVPPQPGCEPRPVVNANVMLRAPDGSELARATSNEQGEIVFSLPPGAYYVEPQPVEGLMGTAPPVAFSVAAGDVFAINLDYDTGIR